jgi:recombinational DNA repair protein (RecF pathway)
MCDALGFGMSLDACRRCGEKKPMKGFSLASGGFLCADCFKPEAGTLALSGEIWGALRFLSTCPPEAAVRLVVPAHIGRRIEALFLMYFKYHVPGLRGFTTWRALPQAYWGEKAVETEKPHE